MTTVTVSSRINAPIGRVFDQSPQYWLNLQASYDLKTVESAIGKRLAAVRPFYRDQLTPDRAGHT